MLAVLTAWARLYRAWYRGNVGILRGLSTATEHPSMASQGQVWGLVNVKAPLCNEDGPRRASCIVGILGNWRLVRVITMEGNHLLLGLRSSVT